MGIAYLGVGFGGMLVPQLARWVNFNFGWHEALMILGVLMIVVAFPMAWFAKENPEGVSGQVKHDDSKIPFGPILKSWPFYLLVIGSMCSIGAVAGTSQNLKLFFFIDFKYSQEHAPNLLSLVLASSIIGRLFIGWVAERIQKKKVMILIFALLGVFITPL